MTFVSDPWFYVLAIPVVLIYGVGKGGLGGSLGIIAVPIMALVISPTQAAAILLPILIVMDAFAVRFHYRNADRQLLRQMLPGSIVGVVLAGMFLASVPEAALKMVIGCLSLIFCIQHWVQLSVQEGKRDNLTAWFWSILSGFSSTAIHAGGGPASIYLLPLRLDKCTLIATMAVLFSIINLVKIFPYLALGEFNSINLATAIILLPLAPIGVWFGVRLLHIVSQEFVYQFSYLLLFLSGAKLIFDALNSSI